MELILSLYDHSISILGSMIYPHMRGVVYEMSIFGRRFRSSSVPSRPPDQARPVTFRNYSHESLVICLLVSDIITGSTSCYFGEPSVGMSHSAEARRGESSETISNTATAEFVSENPPLTLNDTKLVQLPKESPLDIEHAVVQDDPRLWSSQRKVRFH